MLLLLFLKYNIIYNNLCSKNVLTKNIHFVYICYITYNFSIGLTYFMVWKKTADNLNEKAKLQAVWMKKRNIYVSKWCWNSAKTFPKTSQFRYTFP